MEARTANRVDGSAIDLRSAPLPYRQAGLTPLPKLRDKGLVTIAIGTAVRKLMGSIPCKALTLLGSPYVEVF
jgi:hypothetical protein